MQSCRVRLTAALTAALAVALIGCATSGDDAAPDQQDVVQQQSDGEDADSSASSEQEEQQVAQKQMRLGIEDIDELADAGTGQLDDSEILERWEQMDAGDERADVAVSILYVDEQQHELAPQAQTLLDRIEIHLVNHAPVDVMAHPDEQTELLEELARQSDDVDLEDLQSDGEPYQPRFIITGALERHSGDEPGESVFELVLEVVDVEDEQIVFDTEQRLVRP